MGDFLDFFFNFKGSLGVEGDWIGELLILIILLNKGGGWVVLMGVEVMILFEVWVVFMGFCMVLFIFWIVLVLSMGKVGVFFLV